MASGKKTHWTVFLFISCRDAFTGQFAPLSDGDEGGTQPHRNNGADKEASSIQAHYDIDFPDGCSGKSDCSYMMNETGDQSFEQEWFAKDWEYI